MAMERLRLMAAVAGLAAACVLGRSGLATEDAIAPADAAGLPTGAVDSTRAMPDFETVIDDLIRRSEGGDIEAQWSLGMRYRFGVGVAADLEAARQWLKRAAEADHAEACRAYAWMCVAESQDKKAIAEATKWMARASALGNLDAMVEEADFSTTMMNLGSVVKKLHAAAERGSVAAQARYGLIASSGMAGAKDKDAAEQFLRAAADAGSPLAAESAGMSLVMGTRESEPSSEQMRRGMAYLRFAAEHGRPDAQYYLGSELRRLARDQRTASPEGVRWIAQAAEQNHVGALTRMGGMYLTGDGVPKDVAKGAEFIDRTAGIGAQYSAVRVGLLYEEGREVPRDMATALRWYRKGADFGDVEAQSALARVLSSGDGVERDLVEAYKWANIVAAKGGADEIAQRDAIAESLTSAQISEGQSRASSFKQIPLISPAGRPKTAPPEFQIVDGLVTGFFVSNDGYLVTSSPLLAKARRVRVYVAGAPIDAAIVRFDAASEAALLKVAHEARFVSVAQETSFTGGGIEIESYPTPWGEWANASRRGAELMTPTSMGFAWLQVDARAGNSGGAVMNAEGKAIGVMAHRVPMMSALVPPEVGNDMANLFSGVTPAFGIDRASPLLEGVDLDGAQPTDSKAIGPFVVVMIEL